MRFVQYLLEATRNDAEAYNEYVQAFKSAMQGEAVPSAKQLLGMLNRRTYKAGTNPVLDFTTDFFLKRGYLRQQGSMVVPTESGSRLRGSISAPVHGGQTLSQASGQGYKALRRYFNDVTDAVTKDYLASLDEPTLKAIATARELDQEDVSILNGIRDKAENHRERSQYVQAMREKNPDRLDRLIELGFIDAKTGAFNKSRWDSFVATINELDPARIKTLVPQFYEWSTHKSGNIAKNINRILFAIHPSSRNQTEVGRHVWQIVKNLDNDTFNLLKNGKKPKQGELSDESYKLLTTIVPLVVKSFPEAQTPEGLKDAIDDAFESRVDFKSLDRSGEKTASRRNSVADTFKAQ